VDRLGVAVNNVPLSYAIEDPQIAAVGEGGEVSALNDGTTGLPVSTGGHTSRVGVRIGQRPTHVRFSSDTIRFQAFGDSVTFGAIALDSLGSPVAGGITGVALADPTIGVVMDSSTVHAIGNGVTLATVAVAGIKGQLVIEVNQVPRTLNVSSTFGSAVITLPAGASFPLSCQATDRNGYAIARDPALVASVKGTVTGSGCSDAQVARSGYDTLVFALGAMQVRLPVIVATAPDSVGIVTAAQPLSVDPFYRYVGEDLAKPSILALRPLVTEILAAYGNPTTNLGRARAIRDWVARTAVYPDPTVHPGGSTSNLSVLPPGTTWADVNATLSADEWNRDTDYWTPVSADGYVMLERLLGTLDPSTGQRADDGLMVHVSGAQYRIRDLDSYRYSPCTFQSVLAITLWAAAGLQGLLVHVPEHEPAAVFIPELSRWVYEDVAFSDDYLLDGGGEPLSPLDLLALAKEGSSSRVVPSKVAGPTYDPAVYVQNRTYMSVVPEGAVFVGSRLYMNDVVNATAWTGFMSIVDSSDQTDHPEFASSLVTAAQAFPTLGVSIGALSMSDSVYVANLGSTLPNHQRFERRLNGGPWQAAADIDVLPFGACRVEYRRVDAQGNTSALTVVDVWAPRATDFPKTADPASVRAHASLCVE